MQYGIAATLSKPQIALIEHCEGEAAAPADHFVNEEVNRDKVGVDVKVGDAVKREVQLRRDDDVHVSPGLAIVRVGRETGGDVDKGVVAGAAVNCANAAKQIVAIAAADHVGADEIEDPVIAVAAINGVIAIGTQAFIEDVVAGSARQDVVAVTAAQVIVAHAAIDDVGVGRADEQLIGRRADDRRTEYQCHSVGAEK